jgi:hypothetical protein
MPTPSPGNPISMNDVYNETNLTRNMDNFFDVANVGGGGGLMYHNLAMGPTTSQTAADAVWSRFNAGTDMNLSAWYNYTQDADMHFTYDFKNNSVDYNIDVTIYFEDPVAPGLQLVTGFTVMNSGGIQNAEILTGLLANTNFPNGLYTIWIDCNAFYIGGAPPGPGVVPDPTNASDTDGVGPGLVRNGNTIPPFDEFNPIINYLVVEGNISGANGIYVNKRTTLNITFN